MDDSNFRASCYEAIATMISRAPKDCFPVISNYTMLVLERLEQTIALQFQLVGGDDKNIHFEFQANLYVVLPVFISFRCLEIQFFRAFLQD